MTAKRLFTAFLALCLVLPFLAQTPITGSAASITTTTPQIALPNAITVATVYRGVTGINPANGHDLMYLMFKGGTVIVYDIDAKEVYDTITGTPSTPFDATFDDEGNFWLCGSGAALYKYTPATKTMKKYGFDKTLFMGVGNLYAVTFYEGMLYFGTSSYGHLGMMDPQTGKVTVLSDWLNVYPNQDPDAYYCGWGGMHIVDGYIYTTLDGDRNGDQIVSHQVIKFDIANRKIVDFVDLSDTFKTAATGISYLGYADGVLFPTLSSVVDGPVAIDISGSKMQTVTVSNMGKGYVMRTSAELDGKYYTVGYNGTKRSLFSYDPATKKSAALMQVSSSLAASNAVVTVTGDSRLPGKSLVTYSLSSGKVNLTFYNPQTQDTVVWEDVLKGEGSGNNLRAITTDPTGRYVYVGCYGYNKITCYDTVTGEYETYDGYGHQTDSLMFYGGYLWVGNYNTGTLTRFDTETASPTPMFHLMSSVFQQKRMFGLTAGDNTVFCSTVPDTGMYGGTLNWVDLETGYVYVAAGPNPEDCYYTLGSGWFNAATNQYESFDADGDYRYDTYITVDGQLRQRFYGLVENRCLNCIVYQNGYIYGTTTKANGMGEGTDSVTGNAQIFVYDVKAKKLVGLCDLSEKIPGLATPVPYVNVVAADPTEPGKFWGMVSETLFSYTFDPETGEFDVQVEVSLGKTEYKVGLGSWFPSSMIFEGDYIYACFGNQGMYMVRRSDPTEHYKVTATAVDQMTLAADGNLYFVDNVSTNIHILEIAGKTKSLTAASVQAAIDALPTTLNESHYDQVSDARILYDSLSDPAKKLVDEAKLLAAEEAVKNYTPAPTDPPSEPAPEPILPTQPTEPANPADPTSPTEPSQPNSSESSTGGAEGPNAVEVKPNKFPWVAVIAIGVLIAAGVGIFFYCKKKKK